MASLSGGEGRLSDRELSDRISRLLDSAAEKAFSELEEQRPTKSEAQQQQRQQENATKMAEARIEEVEANMRSSPQSLTEEQRAQALSAVGMDEAEKERLAAQKAFHKRLHDQLASIRDTVQAKAPSAPPSRAKDTAAHAEAEELLRELGLTNVVQKAKTVGGTTEAATAPEDGAAVSAVETDVATGMQPERLTTEAGQEARSGGKTGAATLLEQPALSAMSPEIQRKRLFSDATRARIAAIKELQAKANAFNEVEEAPEAEDASQAAVASVAATQEFRSNNCTSSNSNDFAVEAPQADDAIQGSPADVAQPLLDTVKKLEDKYQDPRKDSRLLASVKDLQALKDELALRVQVNASITHLKTLQIEATTESRREELQEMINELMTDMRDLEAGKLSYNKEFREPPLEVIAPQTDPVEVPAHETNPAKARAQELFSEGLAHMLRGEHEEAAVFYTQVLAARLKDVEFNVEVLGLRALSKFEQKLYLEAVLDTSSVIDTVTGTGDNDNDSNQHLSEHNGAMDKELQDALELRAKAYYAIGDYKAALDDYFMLLADDSSREGVKEHHDALVEWDKKEQPIQKHKYVNHYTVLRIPSDAETAVVNRKFKELAFRLNPEKVLPKEAREHAASLLSYIRTAHQVLSDSHKRAEFDQLLASFKDPLTAHQQPKTLGWFGW